MSHVTRTAFAFLALAATWVLPLRAEEAAPLVDMPKLIESVRKSVSIPNHIQVKIADVRPTPIAGLLQGVLEMRMENNAAQVRRDNIFISTDSRYFLLGNIYDTTVDMDAQRRGMIKMDEAHFKGRADAPVTVVEYSDFQCESCRVAAEGLRNEKFMETYKGKVKFVFKHFPISRNHKWALQAHAAAFCAGKLAPQGFWNLHDQIFARQNEIVPENVRQKVLEFAREAGVDQGKFTQCLDNPESMARVNADITEGQALGVYSTPTFFVNGRVIVGYRGSNELKQLVDEFLPKKQ